MIVIVTAEMLNENERKKAEAAPAAWNVPTTGTLAIMVAAAPTEPFPDGFNRKPEPFGVAFGGLPCSEPRLLALAYAFEQATKKRVLKRRGPPLEFAAIDAPVEFAAVASSRGVARTIR